MQFIYGNHPDVMSHICYGQDGGVCFEFKNGGMHVGDGDAHFFAVIYCPFCGRPKSKTEAVGGIGATVVALLEKTMEYDPPTVSYVTKAETNDADGYTVSARMNDNAKWFKVGSFVDYSLANLFMHQLHGDAQLRREAIRDARGFDVVTNEPVSRRQRIPRENRPKQRTILEL